MKPVFQTQFVGDATSDECGNCLAACVASILELDLEDVPNFAAITEPDKDAWWRALQGFVTERGFFLYPLDPELGAPEDTYTIAVGKSPRGDFNHCAVAFGTQVVHDPNPHQDGPAFDGYAKELYLFVARDPARSIAKAEVAS